MYHFNVIRGKMTQALGQYLPRMVQESGHAFEVEVGNSADWREMQMWPLTSKVVTRMANAMLVGEPLCRDDEYLQFSCDITPLVFDTAAKIRNYPEFLKPIMMYFMEDRKRQLQIARKHLIPLIKQRLGQASLPAVQSKAERPDDTRKFCLLSPVTLTGTDNPTMNSAMARGYDTARKTRPGNPHAKTAPYQCERDSRARLHFD